jgi:hypothetical protein
MDIESFKAELDAASAITMQQPENSVLVLTDIRGTVLTREAVSIAKDSSAQTTKFVYRTAILGIEGFRKVLLDAVSRFSGQKIVTFDDINEAKDWLVSQPEPKHQSEESWD